MTKHLPFRLGTTIMRLVACFSVAMMLPVGICDAADNKLSADEISQGWISLFDWQTLYGWRAASQAKWQVANGTIEVSAGERGLLRTTTQYSDYVLKLDFRSATGTNSGIFLHTSPRPKNPQTDCYELNIADADNPFPTGSLVGRKKAGKVEHKDDWQSYEITVQGGQIQVKLDGKPVMNYVDPRPLRRGYIGLQLNAGKVAFRNIKLQPLNAKSLFDGKSLAGWKTYPNMASKFTVSPEGWLHVENGLGQLETTKSYGDFALQLECRTNAAELNSGIFFRCIPGDQMMGYECQIHNGFLDNDRSKPKDWGTGAFFRRSKARRVVANDKEWFHLTLIADGYHMAAWVNGYQVSDWTDNRKPNVNPRRGKRREPGTIMIQGHDPTTNIDFRNLRLATWGQRNR